MAVRQILRESPAHVRLFEPISRERIRKTSPRRTGSPTRRSRHAWDGSRRPQPSPKHVGHLAFVMQRPCSYETRDNPCSALNRW